MARTRNTASNRRQSPEQVIVVVWDGCRRDFLGPELTPVLWRLRGEGCDFPDSRAVFPSATRVNAAALSTGSPPGANGLVANKLFDPNVFRDRLLDTSDLSHLKAMEIAYGGALLTATTLGEQLAAHERSLAVVTSGSEGTTFLLNPHAEKLGQAMMAVKDWNMSTPKDLADVAIARLGPIPPSGRPNAARTRYATDVLLEIILPERDPDVMILWFNDPDFTLHDCGVGSDESLEAIRECDRQLGRIVEWRKVSGREESVQIIVASDHGQITAQTRIPIRDVLSGSGIKLGRAEEPSLSLVGALSYYGVVNALDDDQKSLRGFCEWLMEQSWCGSVFTRGKDQVQGSVPGTLSMDLLTVIHDRTPDLYFMMAGDNELNKYGLPGRVFFEGDVPEGGGTHGGLHPHELNNLLIANGSRFQSGSKSPFRAGIIDIAPTILKILGIDQPSTMRGRVLAEGLADAGTTDLNMETREIDAEQAGRRQILKYSKVGETIYLDGGWVEWGGQKQGPLF